MALLIWQFIILTSALFTSSVRSCPAFQGCPFASGSKNQIINWAERHAHEQKGRATNPEGIPIPSLVASQYVQPAGPVLLQDHFLMQRLAAFNRERIPERVVHAKGTGAFGVFEVTHDVSHLTKAKVFNGIGKKTRVAVRFSTTSGETGAADTVLDVRGFAVKFYTEDGIYDLVGIHVESFFIRDPILFPDLNRSRKRNPATNLKDKNMFWDFVSLRSETALANMYVFAPPKIPARIRDMEGFGVHAFKWVNSHGHPIYVKYHWKIRHERMTLDPETYERLAGSNPDHMSQELYDSIARGDFPVWDLNVQIMTFEQAAALRYNPFDATKPWSTTEFPLHPVGTMTLNQNPVDFFTQVNELGFCPSRFVPGIEPSSDPLLQGRIFAYEDALRYRLGVNHAELLVNSPMSPTRSFYFRDGFMRNTLQGAGAPNYFPNSYGDVREDPTAMQTTFHVSGDVQRVDVNDQDFSFAVDYLENQLTLDERQKLVRNLAMDLAKAEPRIQQQYLKNIAYKISHEFGYEIEQHLSHFSGRNSFNNGSNTGTSVY